MRRTLPWVLLAISVALNAFFVGGHFYARRMAEHHGPPHGMSRSEAIERLGLDAEQRRALSELRESFRQRVRANRAADRELGLKLFAEAGKPQLDTAAVEQLTAKLSERRMEHLRAAMPDLQRFLSKLSPEQRTRAQELAETRGPMFLLLPIDRGPPGPERRPPG